MILRPYQSTLIAKLRSVATKRPIAVLPCGAGKTVVAAQIIVGARSKGKRTLFLTHRRELIRQAFRRIVDQSEGEIIPGIISPDAQPEIDLPVQIASIQTLDTRREYPPADLVIIDECSHARAESWQRVLDNYPKAAFIGLTATPYRLDGKGLGDIFGEIVVGATYSDLCTLGILHKPEVYAPAVPDLKGLKAKMGDFSASDLEPVVQGLVGDIVQHWQRLASGRRTIAFAVSIEHSKAICREFLAAGIPAEHIDGGTPMRDRDAAIERLESGETLVLCNVDLLGEGFDLPALEVAILARPTASLALHVQQVGRVMRLCDGKEGALILDHAGNHLRHGEVTDELTFSLTDKVKRAAPLDALKRCKACFLIYEGDECPECGAPSETATKPRELIPDQDREANLYKLMPRIARAEVYRTLVLDAVRLGRRLGWARHDFKAKFGVWPRYPEIEDLYVCRRHEPETKTYGGRSVTRCSRCYRNVGTGDPARDPAGVGL